MKNKIIISMILLLTITLYAEEITLPTLTISSDKNTVLSGENINIIATVTGWNENEMGMPASTLFSGIRITNGNNYNVFDNTLPYQWNINYPIDYVGVEKYKATMLFGVDYISSNELTIVVQPDLSSIKQLKYINGQSTVLSLGDFEQLRVIGLFSDGHERDVTLGQLGTIYSENIVNGATITSGDSPSISISMDGVVTAVELGEAEVVATNNGQTAIRRIKVIPNEFEIGNIYDLDDDGDVDSDDIMIVVNSWNSKVGDAKYNSAYDFNSDGIINVIDVMTIASN